MIILPNIVATYFLMKDDAFKGNLLYFIGYILMIIHNYQNGDLVQTFYFTLVWIMTIIGIRKHLKTKGNHI